MASAVEEIIITATLTQCRSAATEYRPLKWGTITIRALTITLVHQGAISWILIIITTIASNSTQCLVVEPP